MYSSYIYNKNWGGDKFLHCLKVERDSFHTTVRLKQDKVDNKKGEENFYFQKTSNEVIFVTPKNNGCMFSLPPGKPFYPSINPLYLLSFSKTI